MPLYRYVPYFKTDAKEIRSGSDEINVWKKENAQNNAEMYRRKIDGNLKNLSFKLNDMLEQGIKGVDAICNQVKTCFDYQPLKNSTPESSREVILSGDEVLQEKPSKKINVFTTNSTPKTKFLNKKISQKSMEKNKKQIGKKTSNSEEREAIAKRRLNQIEKDYQNVVDNLDMVEKMMACITERISKKSPEIVTKTVDVDVKKDKEKERVKGEKKLVQSKSEALYKRDKVDEVVPKFLTTPSKISQKSSSKIRIDDSSSNVNNANVNSTDFDTSQNSSSDVSFKMTNEKKSFYEECLMLNSLSNISVTGEDSDKFEISRSFRELKDTYLKNLKINFDQNAAPIEISKEWSTEIEREIDNEQHPVSRHESEEIITITLPETVSMTSEYSKIETHTEEIDNDTLQITLIVEPKKIDERKVSKKQPAKVTDDITEIKKVNDYQNSISSSSSTVTLDWTREATTKIPDPLEPISTQCKKMFADLMVTNENVNLHQLLNEGGFNSNLLNYLIGQRPKRTKSIRIDASDPELKAIVPEVHRKNAISDLHGRMELQIRQTDSFDGFLNLMDKNRRRALIKQAERQDHTFRCQLRNTSLRKKYPFKFVTASVPASHEKKDSSTPADRKYVNSLWFSPKDFKLKRNSRIFNRKRMEMYCRTLNKDKATPPLPKHKCQRDFPDLGGSKASNYSILVRSGTPIGRRPNTPRRWIRSLDCDMDRPKKLQHCDILDDLTIDDLAPFNSEYPRHDELQNSLLYKLANEQNGDADGALIDLIVPKSHLSQPPCKPLKPIKNATKKKTETTKNPQPQTGSNVKLKINEINMKKSATTRSQTSEKNLNNKPKRKTKKIRKNEEQLVRKILTQSNIASRNNSGNFNVAQYQKAVKLPEFLATGKKTINKLFPYINNPENKVFQKITVLPVSVIYNNDPFKIDGGANNEQEVPRPTSNCSNKKKSILSKIDKKSSNPIDRLTRTKNLKSPHHRNNADAMNEFGGDCRKPPWIPAQITSKTPSFKIPTRKRSKESNLKRISLTKLIEKVSKASVANVDNLAHKHKIPNDISSMKTRNDKIQGNIQKSINIIEEKMVDILSTNDRSYKKRTIDRMEKEINRVLELINEHHHRHHHQKHHNLQDQECQHDHQHHTEMIRGTPNEVYVRPDSPTPVTPPIVIGLKMPKPPRRRSISRILKTKSRPATVEEEETTNIVEEVQFEKYETKKTKRHDEILTEIQFENAKTELYPSTIETSCPNLRCPTPIETEPCVDVKKLKKYRNKISKEKFGKFADVVRSKKELIINMREQIDPLPNSWITTILPCLITKTNTLPPLGGGNPNGSIEKLSSFKRTDITPTSYIPSIGTKSDTKVKMEPLSSRVSSKTFASSSIELRDFCRSNDSLVPYGKTQNNFKESLMESHGNLRIYPKKISSTNLTKLLDFLEGFTEIEEKLHKITLTESNKQIWKPEHSIEYNIETIDEEDSKVTIVEENLREIIDEEVLKETIDEDLRDPIIDLSSMDPVEENGGLMNFGNENAMKRIKQMELSVSNVAIIAIPSAYKIEKKVQIYEFQDSNYGTFLKIFYLIFYSFAYFLMNLNYSC